MEMKNAVDSGYWQLYRYNPVGAKKFSLDSKEATASYQDFLLSENRYAQLYKAKP